MADTKISALTAAAVAAGTNELAINEAGTSKKVTLSQVLDFIRSEQNLNVLSTDFTLKASRTMVIVRMVVLNSGVKFVIEAGSILRVL